MFQNAHRHCRSHPQTERPIIHIQPSEWTTVHWKPKEVQWIRDMRINSKCSVPTDFELRHRAATEHDQPGGTAVSGLTVMIQYSPCEQEVDPTVQNRCAYWNLRRQKSISPWRSKERHRTVVPYNGHGTSGLFREDLHQC